MLLTNGVEHIARAGNMREINLGLDLVARTGTGTAGFWQGVLTFPGLQIGAHLLGFMLFERTGMGFLLGDSDVRKCIENSLAFYFQLSCQIVDSNLTHPPRFSSRFPLRFHTNLTVVDFPSAAMRTALFRSVGSCGSLRWLLRCHTL